VIEFAPDTASSKRAKGRLFEIERLLVGCEAPEIVGTTLAGMPFKLSDYRGRVVVLEFWTIHCGPCRQKTPETAARLQHYAGQPFAHIGIHTADDSIQAIREAVKELGVTWPVVVDAPTAGATMGPIATRWQVAGWPTVYVIDHEGIIQSNWAREREMAELVPALLEKARKR
jgi:peroxiredoxin